MKLINFDFGAAEVTFACLGADSYHNAHGCIWFNKALPLGASTACSHIQSVLQESSIHHSYKCAVSIGLSCKRRDIWSGVSNKMGAFSPLHLASAHHRPRFDPRSAYYWLVQLSLLSEMTTQAGLAFANMAASKSI